MFLEPVCEYCFIRSRTVLSWSQFDVVLSVSFSLKAQSINVLVSLNHCRYSILMSCRWRALPQVRIESNYRNSKIAADQLTTPANCIFNPNKHYKHLQGVCLWSMKMMIVSLSYKRKTHHPLIMVCQFHTFNQPDYNFSTNNLLCNFSEYITLIRYYCYKLFDCSVLKLYILFIYLLLYPVQAAKALRSNRKAKGLGPTHF